MTVETTLAHGLKKSVFGTQWKEEHDANLELLDPDRVTSGPLAARLAAGTARRFYFATDSQRLYYDNGASWVESTAAVLSHASSHASGGSDAITIAESQVTGLVADLAGKAASAHAHAIADTTGLQSALDGKSAASHNHGGTYEPVDATILRQANLAGNGSATTPAKSDHNHDTAYEAKNANIQTHIANGSNPHGVTAAQVGLGNAENKTFAIGVADASHAAAGKATPVDADEIPLVDSAASNVLKKLTWANLKATFINTAQTWLAAQIFSADITVPSLNGGQLAGTRNALINGEFNIWQRGTSFAVSTVGSVFYTADRWFGRRNVSGNTTIAQVAGSQAGSRYGVTFGRTSGDSSVYSIYLGQALESNNSYRFAGKQVTLSFYAKKGTNYSGGNLGVSVYASRGIDESADTLMSTGWTNAAAFINTSTAISGSMTRYTFTGVCQSAGGSNTVSQIGILLFYTPSGTASNANDYVQIEQVQLEIGPWATPFEFRDYASELARCLRYYYRLSASSAGSGLSYASGVVFLTTDAYFAFVFPVPMRTIPTIGGSGANDYNIFTDAGNAVSTAIPTISEGEPSSVRLRATSTGMTPGRGCLLDAANVSSYLEFKAEL